MIMRTLCEDEKQYKRIGTSWIFIFRKRNILLLAITLTLRWSNARYIGSLVFIWATSRIHAITFPNVLARKEACL